MPYSWKINSLHFYTYGRQSNHGMCEHIKLSYSFNIWPECCVLRVQVAEGGLSGRRVTEPRYHCGVRFLEARDRWFKSVIWKYNVVFCETDILWRYEWQRKNANKLNEWKRKIYSFERCHQQPKPRRGQPGDSRVIDGLYDRLAKLPWPGAAESRHLSLHRRTPWISVCRRACMAFLTLAIYLTFSDDSIHFRVDE